MNWGLPVGVVVRPGVAVRAGAGQSLSVALVVEEPLELRVAGDALTTTLRTPGSDHALALGFLFAEGVIRGLSDVGTVTHCGRPGASGYGNVVDVTPGPGVALDPEGLEAARRARLVHSGCGACGRAQIDALLARSEPLPFTTTVSPSRLIELPETLAAVQRNFAYTGGLHAAAAVTAGGRVVASAEDVGRHNAVDKVVGRLLLDGCLPGWQEDGPVLLAVSGRCGFEIVQKAAVAGFQVLASISAASHLAVDTAAALGLTLAAFVRESRYTLLAHPERIELAPATTTG